MTGDKICFNSEITSYDALNVNVSELSSEFYLYQNIHVFNHQPVFLAEHLELISSASEVIFGSKITFNQQDIQHRIADLLSANRYHMQSSHIRLRVYRALENSGIFKPFYVIECCRQLLYPRFTVWHKRLMLETMPCLTPALGCTSSLSLGVSSLSKIYAQKYGAEIAAIETVGGTDLNNGVQMLTTVGDEPLFVVFGKSVVTSPLSGSMPDTVMRRALIRAITQAGMELVEEPITPTMLVGCDEAFTCDVQGIISINGYRNQRYYNIIATRLVDFLNRQAAFSL